MCSSPVLLSCTECEGGSVAPPGPPMRRISRWLPIFTTWGNECSSLSVLAIEDVNPSRLQCKVYTYDSPGGIVKAHQLRFMNPDTLENWLQRAQRIAPADRNHRCTCCLEWIYSESMRCTTCEHPMHARCAKQWFEHSRHCPTCRTPWDTPGAEGEVASTEAAGGSVSHSGPKARRFEIAWKLWKPRSRASSGTSTTTTPPPWHRANSEGADSRPALTPRDRSRARSVSALRTHADSSSVA